MKWWDWWWDDLMDWFRSPLNEKWWRLGQVLRVFLHLIASPQCFCDSEDCWVYRCPGCWRIRPWCFGAADDMPDHCDDCWAKAHATEMNDAGS